MLVFSLAMVFLAFCAIMASVLMVCIRERRKVDGFDANKHPLLTASNIKAQDSRLIKVLFGTIIAGALLALITGYLVFFRVWD